MESEASLDASVLPSEVLDVVPSEVLDVVPLKHFTFWQPRLSCRSFQRRAMETATLALRGGRLELLFANQSYGSERFFSHEAKFF